MRYTRKLMMLFVSAIAMVMFAVPAAALAEGPFWHLESEKLEAEKEVEVDLDGTLSFSFSWGLVNITCSERHFEGMIRNGEEVAEGEISSLTAAPCSTNLPAGCTVNSLSAQSQPWPMAIGESFDLENVYFHADLSTPCQQFGFPKSLAWTGTLKGEWNYITSCIQYISAGNLALTFGGAAMSTTGELCATSEEGVPTLE
jgi:hypothetical protein